MIVSMFSREVKKMAQSHSATPSMTLPISCHICLGKVSQPVVCSNHHVFCSSCMAMWLKKASQCPTCRVPITAENPCKEIIGGTNEDKSSDDRATRKCLRKTRGELLLREYEDEFEELVKENELLKSQKQCLQEQVEAVLISARENSLQQEDGDSVFMQDLRKDMQTATEAAGAQFQQEIEGLKETCKMLRTQKMNLVQENNRLRLEVHNRSPKKFGRLTVQVLESRLEQCEHDRQNLRKALERSDKYMEELQRQLRIVVKRCLDLEDASGKSKAGTENLTRRERIKLMLQRSSDADDEEIDCSCPGEESSSSSGNLNLASRPSVEGSEVGGAAAQDQSEDSDSEGSPCDTLPATPSTALRALTLRSPDEEKMRPCKPLPHQRRLNFNCSPEKEQNVVRYRHFPIFGQSPCADFMKLSMSTFWSSLQKPNFDLPGPSKQSSPKGSASPDDEEAVLNAAYEDKALELDSLMRESESSVSRASRRVCFDHAFEPPIPGDPYRTDIWQPLKLRKRKKPQKSHNADATSNGKEAEKPSAEEGCSASAEVPGCCEHAGPSQSEEMSRGLPSESMDAVQADPSGPPGSASQPEDPATPPSCGCTPDEPANTSETPELNSSQTSKRKSRSPFSPHGDTKHSKRD